MSSNSGDLEYSTVAARYAGHREEPAMKMYSGSSSSAVRTCAYWYPLRGLSTCDLVSFCRRSKVIESHYIRLVGKNARRVYQSCCALVQNVGWVEPLHESLRCCSS